QGFWLSHSIPRFPPFPERGYGWPPTGKQNGQTALCVTYKYSQFTEIAEQLLYYNPRVYNCSLPEVFLPAVSNLSYICQGSKIPQLPRRRVWKLVSARGESFLNFAKSRYYVNGVILLDRQTGVWLAHSTPKFPGKKRTSFWPENGIYFGQAFLCVTYPYKLFSDIAKQLQYIHIFSFDYDIPQTFPLDLQCVAHRTCYPKKAPWDRKLEMTSLAGSTFVSFAKYAKYGDDLYSGLLVEPLGDDLLAKGWGRLHKPLPSNCSVKHNVYNVKSVKLPPIPPFNITSDHSKWCATMGKKTGVWTCIADMNREIGQMRRGGGAVCTSNTAVWKAFIKMVDRYEKCP
ncbi:DNS2A protein, partial [Polyodon spathula]|nr:DNS2A protein [Polyodon spathula]